MLGFARAGSEGYFDDAGFPTGDNWEEVRFPGLETENVYALEISGDSMEPVYRRGDRIVVAPGVAVRRGDRVVVRTRKGEVLARVLGRQTERMVELAERLVGALLRRPFGSRRVLALIHWQAVRLWWKGATFRPWSKPPRDEVS